MRMDQPLALFDTELVRVDVERSVLYFDTGGVVLALTTSCVSVWTAGLMGCLTLYGAEHFRFRAYPDPRLRRFPALDSASENRWGWTLGEQRFSVRAGVVPGLNGRVIPANVRKLRIDVPSEFLQLCHEHSLAPTVALRVFIADVCALHSLVSEPREDRYASRGADDRRLASLYWERAHAWRRISPPLPFSPLADAD